MSSARLMDTAIGGKAFCTGPVGLSITVIRLLFPLGSTTTSSPGRSTPLATVPRSCGGRGRGSAAGSRTGPGNARRPGSGRRRCRRPRGDSAAAGRHTRACCPAVTTLSPLSAEIGMVVTSWMSSRAANAWNSSRGWLETFLVVVDQVHLVDRQHDVQDAEQGRRGSGGGTAQQALRRRRARSPGRRSRRR